MRVAPTTRHRYVHDGHEVLFCSAGCRERFAREPAAFARPSTLHAAATGAQHAANPQTAASVAAPPSPPRAGANVYTCPMHPEIRQAGPGTCPKCGMALEPVEPGAAEDDPELRDMSRRLRWAAVLTAPLVLIAMGGMVV